MVEELESKDIVRLSIPIEKETNDTLAGMLPARLKAQVVRSLVELFIKAQRDLGPDEYLAQALLKGHCQLTIQNLKGQRK